MSVPKNFKFSVWIQSGDINLGGQSQLRRSENNPIPSHMVQVIVGIHDKLNRSGVSFRISAKQRPWPAFSFSKVSTTSTPSIADHKSGIRAGIALRIVQSPHTTP